MELIRGVVGEGEEIFLVGGEGAREEVASAGRHHVNLLGEIVFQPLKPILGLLHCCLGLCVGTYSAYLHILTLVLIFD